MQDAAVSEAGPSPEIIEGLKKVKEMLKVDPSNIVCTDPSTVSDIYSIKKAIQAIKPFLLEVVKFICKCSNVDLIDYSIIT